MLEEYVVLNGKKFRKGYTTGACAAAAAKASVCMFFSKRLLDFIEIDTPAGVRLKLPVSDVAISEDKVTCAVVKDGGDDPDITTGLKIFADVRITYEEGISVEGGEGVGVVTEPGLKVPVGMPAINPVPMQMIKKEVAEVLPPTKGAHITIRVPGGEEAAKKTYNPRLGILGGISILGTKGIVVPMSEEAWKESIYLEIDMAAARGDRMLVFTFGNIGEDFVGNTLKLPHKGIIKISNFVGDMLQRASEKKLQKILLAGHIGKLVKVSAGIFQTHSRIADARMEILSSYAALEGASKEIIHEIYACKTTDGAVKILDANGLEEVYHRIVNQASIRCMHHVFNKIKVGAVLCDSYNRILATDALAREMLEKSKRYL